MRNRNASLRAAPNNDWGCPYSVRIDLTLPSHELVVTKVKNEDVYVALRDAFDSMKRQLEDVVRKRRGQEKQHPVPLHGEIVRLDDSVGFGFIRTPVGDEYYFSHDSVTGTPFEHVQEGSAVRCSSFPMWVAKICRPGASAWASTAWVEASSRASCSLWACSQRKRTSTRWGNA